MWRLGAVLLALLAACGSETGGTVGGAKVVVPVGVATVGRRDVAVTLRAVGTVEAFTTVALKAQVEGQVAEVHFTEGGEVRRGDLLIEIDARPFEAALHQAEANLARDAAEARQASAEASRVGSLRATGVTSADEHERARARHDSLDAAVRADQAAIERAQLALEYCRIRSPVDGRVGRALVQRGNVVEANKTTLAVVNQIRPSYVQFAVPAGELAGVRAAAAAGNAVVGVTIRGRQGAPIEGALGFVDNAVDTTSGTILLRAQFENADEALWPGQFVDVTLRVSVETDRVVMPARALQTGQQGSYVYVVGADATVTQRPVDVVRTVDDFAVVASGVAPGDRVVTDGQLRLAPGVTVEVKDASP